MRLVFFTLVAVVWLANATMRSSTPAVRRRPVREGSGPIMSGVFRVLLVVTGLACVATVLAAISFLR